MPDAQGLNYSHGLGPSWSYLYDAVVPRTESAERVKGPGSSPEDSQQAGRPALKGIKRGPQSDRLESWPNEPYRPQLDPGCNSRFQMVVRVG